MCAMRKPRMRDAVGSFLASLYILPRSARDGGAPQRTSGCGVAPPRIKEKMRTRIASRSTISSLAQAQQTAASLAMNRSATFTTSPGGIFHGFTHHHVYHIILAASVFCLYLRRCYFRLQKRKPYGEIHRDYCKIEKAGELPNDLPHCICIPLASAAHAPLLLGWLKLLRGLLRRRSRGDLAGAFRAAAASSAASRFSPRR